MNGKPAQPAPGPAAFEAPGYMNAGRLLTADELAERWQVTRGHVYYLTREGVLPTVRIGRYYRYRVAAVEAFEQAGGGGADG